MPTTYQDQFYEIDPGTEPPPGISLTVVDLVMVDNDDDNLIEASTNTTPDPDTVDGVRVESVWPGDTITIERADGTQVTYTGTTFYLIDGRRFFTPTDGSILEPGVLVSSTFVETNGPLDVTRLGPPCFTPGTLIDTPRGPVPVQDLEQGDLVMTVDAGPVPIARICRRELGADRLRANPSHGPVLIRRGALGFGMPKRDLVVSPQHRMVLRSPIIERVFGTGEVLAPAAHLVDAPGIARMDVDQVSYIHLILVDHHVIRAEGAETETFFYGDQIDKCLNPRELTLLEQCLSALKRRPTRPARMLVRGAKLRQAIARHRKNGKALVAPAVPDAALACAG